MTAEPRLPEQAGLSTELKLAIGVFVVWVLVYASAAIDKQLIDLAAVASVPLIGLCGTLIGLAGAKAIRGGKDD